MGLVFTNMGRVFIKTSNCAGYQYLGTADLAGVSTSFGESSYIYKPSEINVNEYDIIDEIKPQGGATWSTSLTMYLDMDSASLLLDLAKRRCTFSLQVHYGTCINPTEFSDFQTGFLLENVTITDYSTGQLTARSPDARGTIEESVSLTSTDIHQLFTVTFAESSPYASVVQNPMGLFGISLSPNIPCDNSSGGCADSCNIAAFGASSGNGIYTLSRINSTWYSNRLGVHALKDVNDPGVVVYNGTTAIYLLDIETFGNSYMLVYRLNNSQLMDNTTLNAVESETFSGNTYAFGRKTYTINNKLYIAATDTLSGIVAEGLVYDIGKDALSSISLPDSASKVLTGVNGRNNHLLFYGNGYLVYYNQVTGEIVNLSSNLPVASKDIVWVNIASRQQFYINIKTSSTTFRTYCTENGGNTWTAIGSTSEEFVRYAWQNTELGYALGASNTVYESYDGGVVWSETQTLFTLNPTDISLCGGNIAITETNSGRTDSLIAENN